METKKLILIAFLVLAFIQIYIPARTVFEKETIITEGKEFKFKVAPIALNELIRKQYTSLFFLERSFLFNSTENWTNNQVVYVTMTEDSLGFAKVHEVLKEAPVGNPYYIKTVVIVNQQNNIKPSIVFPFNEYHIERSMLPKAKKVNAGANQSTNKPAYAVVIINKGDGFLKDVFVDGKNLKNLADFY